ncbi:hypothetical protein HK405_009564 [Cladochytrium tenue]|nr:hypothetical protein HK405_009564 [Cladochytrium tenue]
MLINAPRRHPALALLAVLGLVATLAPEPARPQADIQSVLGVIPFTRDLDEGCKIAIYTSTTVMDAFRTCGGVYLVAANSAPVSVLQSPSFLDSFCSTNCSSMIQALTQITDCQQSAANLFYNTSQYNEINGASIPTNMAMDLLGNQEFPQVTSTLEALQGVLCPRTADGSAWCVANEINEAVSLLGLSASQVNSLTAVEVVKQPSIACSSCFSGSGTSQGSHYGNLTQAAQVATSFYSYMQPVLTAYKSTIANCSSSLARRNVILNL